MYRMKPKAADKASIPPHTPDYKPKVSRPEITRFTYAPREGFGVQEAFRDHGLAAIPDAKARMELGPIFSEYNVGAYESALDNLAVMVADNPGYEVALWPYLEVCHRVVELGVDPADQIVHKDMSKWFRIRRFHWNWWTKLWTPQLPKLVRCKYCARYQPKESDAEVVSRQIMRTADTCLWCGRHRPMPHDVWDSVPGQVYLFYGQNEDRSFYQSFIERFDVLDLGETGFVPKWSLQVPTRYTWMASAEE
jgi:hypothetical protein